MPSSISPESLEMLIEAGEDEKTDFKVQLDLSRGNKRSRAEFIKDVIAFANSHSPRAAHLLIGVKNKTREIVGIEKGEIDDAVIQQIVRDQVEPNMNLNYREVNINDKVVGVLILQASSQRPFQVKKDFKENEETLLVQGESWIRAGSSRRRLTSHDHQLFKEEYAEFHRPVAKLDTLLTFGATANFPKYCELNFVFSLKNVGDDVAMYPALDIVVPEGVSLDNYGVDGNRNFGLTSRPLRRIPENRRRHMYTSSEVVIHPGTVLDVTQFEYKVGPDTDQLSDLHFEYRSLCRGFSESGQLTISRDELLANRHQ